MTKIRPDHQPSPFKDAKADRTPSWYGAGPGMDPFFLGGALIHQAIGTGGALGRLPLCGILWFESPSLRHGFDDHSGRPIRGIPSGATAARRPLRPHESHVSLSRVRQPPGLSPRAKTRAGDSVTSNPPLSAKAKPPFGGFGGGERGFEPPVLVYPIHSLSRRARSATPASLQGLPDYRWERIGTRLLAQSRAQPSRWRHGGMAERFKATVLKTVVGVSSPRVRISLPPPPQRPANAGRLHEGVVGARFEVTESLAGSRRPAPFGAEHGHSCEEGTPRGWPNLAPSATSAPRECGAPS